MKLRKTKLIDLSRTIPSLEDKEGKLVGGFIGIPPNEESLETLRGYNDNTNNLIGCVCACITKNPKCTNSCINNCNCNSKCLTTDDISNAEQSIYPSDVGQTLVI